jgi:glycosyltransferase involved in cell wall biosynthesis
MKSQIKLIKTSTVAMSLDVLLKGQLKYLNRFFNVIALSGEDEYLCNVKKREKVDTLSVKMNRKINILQDIKSLILLYFIFKKERPTIVHSITPKAGLLSMVASYFARVPIRIHTFTGLIFPTKKGVFKRILIFMDQLTCHFATHIYPEGNGVKQDLINYNITKKPLKVIANGNINGIDGNYFNSKLFKIKDNLELRLQLGIFEKDTVFVFVGRLVRDKGINELVAAFNKILNKNSKLLLVGSLETELDPLNTVTLKEIKTNKNIISVGFQKDVRPYFAISDVLVFPSYREGFPNVVLQAGAMSLPSIVTNINGCNEIIEEGVNGMIIPVKSIDELYLAMKSIIEDEILLMNLKKQTRDMIVNKYEHKYVWDELLKEYKSLLLNV